MHRSRISVVCIDCETDDLGAAMDFWSAALGKTPDADPEGDGRYVSFDGHTGHPKVLLQAVDHAPRVHLDIETDDPEAEVARMRRLGAREVGQFKTWTVMEAPTGHRFCIVGPQGADFPGDAPEWKEQAT